MFKQVAKTAQRGIWMKARAMVAPPAYPGVMGAEVKAKELGPQGPFLDPFNLATGCDRLPQKGTGTKDDPILVPSRNECCLISEDHNRWGLLVPQVQWWVYVEGDGVTENNMCRSVYTGRYFKLIHDPTDYYGVDAEDPHSYPMAQY